MYTIILEEDLNSWVVLSTGVLGRITAVDKHVTVTTEDNELLTFYRNGLATDNDLYSTEYIVQIRSEKKEPVSAEKEEPMVAKKKTTRKPKEAVSANQTTPYVPLIEDKMQPMEERMKIKLTKHSIGKRALTRDGTLVEIVGLDEGASFPFTVRVLSPEDFTVDEYGRFYGNNLRDDYDIVEFLR